MSGLLWKTDLAPGLLAAGLLLGLVFSARIDLTSSLAAALLVYLAGRVGLGWLRGRGFGDPAATSAGRAIRESEQRIAAIALLQSPIDRLHKPDVAQRFARIRQAADRNLQVIKQDPDKRAAAVPYLESWIIPIQTLLEQYVRLSTRGIRSAQPELVKIEQEDLPEIETKLASLYEELHKGDVLNLGVDSEVLSLHLREIDVT